MPRRRVPFGIFLKLSVLLLAALGLYFLVKHPNEKVLTYVGWGCALVLFGTLPLLVIVIVILSRFFPGKPDDREAKLACLATELGLSWSAGEREGFSRRFPGLPVFNQGNVRRATCVMEGRHRGRRVVACDYAYGEGSYSSDGGKIEETTVISVAVVMLDSRLPYLLIRPEGLADKIAGAAGCEDIDFESHEFSRRFHVASDDRHFAYQMLSARVMEYLLAHPKWRIEMIGGDVLIWTGRHWRPEEFRAALEVLHGFLDLAPRFLWKQCGGEPAAPSETGAIE